jgi:hypothetical protein
VLFIWTPQAEGAFRLLKERFSSAPILALPDPSLPFVVEVDASNVGVGAILSQRISDGKLHPCAFYSHRLSPTEARYDVGDRELLAVKMALEEWRHWLEGAQDPFLVWSDHKNLEYLKQAKRLNPRQAQWALFFSGLTSPSHFDQAPRTRNQMPYPDNLRPSALSMTSVPLSPAQGLWPLSAGALRPRSGGLSSRIQDQERVHRIVFLFTRR